MLGLLGSCIFLNCYWFKFFIRRHDLQTVCFCLHLNSVFNHFCLLGVSDGVKVIWNAKLWQIHCADNQTSWRFHAVAFWVFLQLELVGCRAKTRFSWFVSHLTVSFDTFLSIGFYGTSYWVWMEALVTMKYILSQTIALGNLVKSESSLNRFQKFHHYKKKKRVT